jgi:hypothetical protein
MGNRGQDPITNLLYRSRSGALDRTGRLIVKTQCRNCGYELFGLLETARCPECGTPVAASIGGDLLKLCEPAWLAQMAQSARASVWSTVALLITTPVCILALPPSWWSLLPQVLVAALWGQTIWGSSSLEPAEHDLSRAQWALRIGAVAVPVLWLTRFGLLIANLGLSTPATGMISVLAWAGMIVAWVAQLHLYQKLVNRIPIPEIAEDIGFTKRRLAISYGLLITLSLWSYVYVVGVVCCLAIPVSIAAMYYPIQALVRQLHIATLLEIEVQEARGAWAFHNTNAQVNSPIAKPDDAGPSQTP